MSISNILTPNDLSLYCGDITVKNSDANLTGIYDIDFLNNPLQQFFNVDTVDPTVLVFKSGDFVIVNGAVDITMNQDTKFINAIIVLPIIPGYNLYENLAVISGDAKGDIRQVGTMTQAIADTASEISVAWQENDGTGFENNEGYIISFTIRYRLTNL